MTQPDSAAPHQALATESAASPWSSDAKPADSSPAPTGSSIDSFPAPTIDSSPAPSIDSSRPWTAELPGIPLPPPLGWRPATAAAYPLPPTAPVPPAPPGRPKPPRALLLAGVGCLLAALLFGMLTVFQYHSAHSAQAAVRRYFHALATGDAAAALGAAAQPPRGVYLTESVLRQQLRVAAISDISVRGAHLVGNSGTVAVRYRLRFASGAEQVTDSVPVRRHGSSWRLDRVAAATELTVASAGTDRLMLAGGKLPDRPVLLFPGALPLGTDNPAVQVDSRPVLRLEADQQPTEVTASLTDSAKERVRHSVEQSLAGCLRPTTARPNCPAAGDTRPVPGTLHGTALPSQPPLVISLGLNGEVDVAGVVTVHGSWQDWDYNNQRVQHSGDTKLNLFARASIADLDTIYWGEP
jgi:hypothetical protein